MMKQMRPSKVASPGPSSAARGSAVRSSATAVLAPPDYGIDFADRGVPAPGNESATGRTRLPAPVRSKMENFFGHDFSGLEIHRDSSHVSALHALAYTRGNEIHFAPGQYLPHTRSGQGV